MREKSLDDRIYAVVAEAASVIADIVRGEIAAEVQKVVSARTKNGRGTRRALPKTEKRSGRGRKRRKMDVRTVTRVLDVVKANPGLRSEQLYEKVELPREVTKRALATLRQDKRVKTKGARRSTTYAAA